MSAYPRPFPPGFRFGAATAAMQIEGATAEGGRRDSIWDVFCRQPGTIESGDTVDVACDHYHRYRDDVGLMSTLGLDTYRFSTSWARVCPDGGPVNPVGLAFYSRLVDELLSAGIEPWLTLYHWDLPQALQDRGGWTNRDTVSRFVDYARAVHGTLGDRVSIWTTLNEPWCSSFLSYIAGAHAPGHQSVTEGLTAAHHLLLAHGRTVAALREADSDLSLGITLNFTVADPVNPSDPVDVDAARRIDGQFNRWFLDPIFRGRYPADVLDDIRAVDAGAVSALEAAIDTDDLASIAAPIDVLGVNYYHGELVGGRPPAQPPITLAPHGTRPTVSPFPAADNVFWYERGLPRTGMGWEVQPEGLTRLLQRISADYAEGIPLYVTENGAAYPDVVELGGNGDTTAANTAGITERWVNDAERSSYLKNHLMAVLDAIDAGVDVRGYFYWSLMDNFEWAWGYGKRFGLIYVDFATQDRIIKESGHTYGKIIAARSLGDAD